jgi:hypothetical protein
MRCPFKIGFVPCRFEAGHVQDHAIDYGKIGETLDQIGRAEMKRFKTEIQTPGKPAQLSIEGRLAEMLARLGIEGSIILSRKDGKELSEEDLIHAEGAILAVLGVESE